MSNKQLNHRHIVLLLIGKGNYNDYCFKLYFCTDPLMLFLFRYRNSAFDVVGDTCCGHVLGHISYPSYFLLLPKESWKVSEAIQQKINNNNNIH